MSANFPAPRDLARDPEHPLARAFASFTEAAGSLERTYGQLQGQVAHLRKELEVTNRDLAKSLEENHRIRERLRRILEGLPCGVLVVEGGSRIAIVNPEAARLAGAVSSRWTACRPGSPPRSTGREGRAKSANGHWPVPPRPGPSGSRSATPGWNETRPMPPRFLLCAMSARRRSWNRIASICGGSRRWWRCRRCWRMRSATRWAAWNCLRGCWPKRIWKGKAGAGSNTYRPACARYRPPSTTCCTCTTRRNPSSRPATWASCSTGRTISCCRWPSRRGWKCRSSTGSLASSFRRTGTGWSRYCSTSR